MLTRHRAVAPAEATTTADNPGVIARPPRIGYLLLGIGAILQWLWPTSLLPAAWSGWPRYPTGSGLIAAGLLLMTLGIQAFRKTGTNVETPKPATALVLDGIYSRSRNPMYVALLLLFAGIAVLANSGWLGALLVVYLAVLRVGVIAREERYLEQKFGDPYRVYRGRVRRWL